MRSLLYITFIFSVIIFTLSAFKANQNCVNIEIEYPKVWEDSLKVDKRYDLKLVSYENKLKVIKEVRLITGWGLTECKTKVDQAPVIILKNLEGERAAALKLQFESASATVEAIEITE